MRGKLVVCLLRMLIPLAVAACLLVPGLPAGDTTAAETYQEETAIATVRGNLGWDVNEDVIGPGEVLPVLAADFGEVSTAGPDPRLWGDLGVLVERTPYGTPIRVSFGHAVLNQGGPGDVFIGLTCNCLGVDELTASGVFHMDERELVKVWIDFCAVCVGCGNYFDYTWTTRAALPTDPTTPQGDYLDDWVVARSLMEGDATWNWSVTINDALVIAQYKAGMISLASGQLLRADTTDDGIVTIADAMHIAQWLVDPTGSLGVLTKPLWQSPADDAMLPPQP